MARLEAVAKGLFYPTPDRVVDMIADRVKIEGNGTLALLDPCAGEGRAAAILAHRWNCRAYGVELHEERAAKAAEVLSHCWQGSFRQLDYRRTKGMASPPPQEVASPFGVLFCNPPYDWDSRDEDGHSRRQEVECIRAVLPFLGTGGLLIAIVPRAILDRRDFRTTMRDKFTRVDAYRFPSPEDEAFDQVVVFAVRASSFSYGSLNNFDDPPPLSELVEYQLGWNKPPHHTPNLVMRGEAPEASRPRYDGPIVSGGYASPQWRAMTGDEAQRELQPLLEPRPGHQAMLLAAGCLNGLELVDIPAEGEAQPDLFPARVLVKGGSEKVTVEAKGDNERIERERIASYLSVLNLTTGELDSWRVEDDEAKTARWFEHHGPALAKGILGAHAPQFTAEMAAQLDLTGLRAPGILPGRTAPEILAPQREAAGAIVHRWRRHKTAILCGEMGTGKTTMGTLAGELSGLRRFVIICPTHLVPKWVREIGVITGRPNAAVAGRRLADVDDFFADPTPTTRYLVISKETAKLGARWVHASTRRGVIRSHEVRKIVAIPDFPYKREELHTENRRHENDTCPHCGGIVVLSEKVQTRCGGCSQPQWQYVPITAKGTKRWPLATYIHRRYARRYGLIVDEAHQHGKGDSDQAVAVHRLRTGALRVLEMTGTLYGGRASSLFHMLYRSDRAFRRAYKHSDVAAFVAHYGLFETSWPEEERTSTYGTRRGKASGGRVKEIPGMHPRMVAMLLPFTIFVKLKDLELELPPYTEHVLEVTPDPDVLRAANEMASKCRAVLKKYPQVLGAYLQACLGYPDRADQREEIVAQTEHAGDVLVASAPALPEATYPKDDAVVRLCEQEHAAGRKVLVFCTQTQRRDVRSRLRKALEDTGLKVVTLDASVAPEKREEWVRKALEQGFDVMLTNGRLVETGMDLLFARTIVQYGVEYSINTLRQSVRRSWRLGQDQPIHVYFVAYAGTMQATALNLIARKMRAAELVDGDAAGGLAQHDVEGGNFLLELAHEVLGAYLDDEDAAA
jgi:superfamily II DNA or RNA helicase/ribosomal protein S27AE